MMCGGVLLNDVRMMCQNDVRNDVRIALAEKLGKDRLRMWCVVWQDVTDGSYIYICTDIH